MDKFWFGFPPLRSAKMLSGILFLILLTPNRFVRTIPVDFFEHKSTSADVIVIGSGAAGISAASRLVDNGFDVIILEAQDRIGGRIWSYPYHNGTIELGAQAVWGDNNFLIEYVRKQNLIANTTNYASVPIIDTGIPVNQSLNAEIVAINSDFNRFLLYLLDASTLSTYEQSLSLGEYLDQKFAEYVRTASNPDLASTVYDGFVRVLKTEDSADSLYDLSIQTYVRRKDKNTRVTLKVPFVSVLDDIGANIPRKSIFLNERVVRISRKFFTSNGNRMSVRTASGRIFSAHHVIITVSLGVLKAEMDSLFEYGLPLKKQEAIRAAGFGNLAKIAMTFEEKFWNQLQPHIANLPLFWTLDNNVDHERRYTHRFWMRGLESFKSFGGLTPNYTLVGFVPGGRAADMELLSDEFVIANLTAILHQFTGLEIPKPTALIRGNWFHNPNFRGSFSYISQEFSEHGFTNADLAEPAWYEYNFRTRSFEPLLMFAGEATHDTLFSHVSGALESGFREADRIINIYKGL